MAKTKFADAILRALLDDMRELEDRMAIVHMQICDLARARGVLPPERDPEMAGRRAVREYLAKQ